MPITDPLTEATDPSDIKYRILRRYLSDSTIFTLQVRLPRQRAWHNLARDLKQATEGTGTPFTIGSRRSPSDWGAVLLVDGSGPWVIHGEDSAHAFGRHVVNTIKKLLTGQGEPAPASFTTITAHYRGYVWRLSQHPSSPNARMVTITQPKGDGHAPRFIDVEINNVPHRFYTQKTINADFRWELVLTSLNGTPTPVTGDRQDQIDVGGSYARAVIDRLAYRLSRDTETTDLDNPPTDTSNPATIDPGDAEDPLQSERDALRAATTYLEDAGKVLTSTSAALMQTIASLDEALAHNSLQSLAAHLAGASDIVDTALSDHERKARARLHDVTRNDQSRTDEA